MNTSTWRQSLVFTRWASSSRLRSWLTGCWTCATSSAGVLRRATSTVAGFFMKEPGELADLVREGGREQQVLARRGQQGEDLADVVDEAHVEHAVGFVQHQDLDLAQVDGLLLHVVEQAAGRGDDDVDAAAQRVDLRLHADAAVDDGGLQLQVLAVGADALLDLQRELARRA